MVQSAPIASAICHTTGCPLEAVAVDLVFDASVFVCGGCSTEITDITPTEGGAP